MTIAGLIAGDLEAAVERGEPHLRRLKGERLFVTGGTGFVGTWLLELLVHADRRLGLGIRATVLTRHPEALAASRSPLWHAPPIELLRGDVRDFLFPPGRFGLVVHGAASSDDAWNRRHPGEVVDTIVAGTRRVLEFARSSGAERFLFVSSGAVYGPQPQDCAAIEEEFTGAPVIAGTVDAAYGEAKRVAEVLAFLAAAEGLGAVSARVFACYGPFLPLAAHFAFGNFVRDAVAGGPVTVRGDGTAIRAYLYGSDLALGLLSCLTVGRPGLAYNLGAEEAVTMLELANIVARMVHPTATVKVLGEALSTNRYVPSVARARADLGFEPAVPLARGIATMLQWAEAVGVGA